MKDAGKINLPGVLDIQWMWLNKNGGRIQPPRSWRGRRVSLKYRRPAERQRARAKKKNHHMGAPSIYESLSSQPQTAKKGFCGLTGVENPQSFGESYGSGQGGSFTV